MKRGSQSVSLTDAAGLLGRPLVVLLTGDVPFPHQFERRQTLKVQPVPVTKACPFPLAVGGGAGVPAAALVDLCMGITGTKRRPRFQKTAQPQTASQSIDN
jgi:hypothetical protein